MWIYILYVFLSYNPTQTTHFFNKRMTSLPRKYRLFLQTHYLQHKPLLFRQNCNIRWGNSHLSGYIRRGNTDIIDLLVTYSGETIIWMNYVSFDADQSIIYFAFLLIIVHVFLQFMYISYATRICHKRHNSLWLCLSHRRGFGTWGRILSLRKALQAWLNPSQISQPQCIVDGARLCAV